MEEGGQQKENIFLLLIQSFVTEINSIFCQIVRGGEVVTRRVAINHGLAAAVLSGAGSTGALKAIKVGRSKFHPFEGAGYS